MKKGKILKWITRIVIGLLTAVLIFVICIFIVHTIRSRQELDMLKDAGYVNLVSVGDYCLNVAKFGNEDGQHTIVGMAGLGSGDFSLAMRQTTACLEEDNLVVFIDRAGYGLSDDTNNDMTLEYIVKDYRKALENAGIKGPYILMPHSIGGAYANYWASNYPDEIEAIVFLDGSELDENAFDDYDTDAVGVEDRLLAFLAKIGLSRFVLRNYFYLYPDNYTEEEQKLGDALMLRTLDSIAPVSEDSLLVSNAQKAFAGMISNDIPKLYICASWGLNSKESIEENNKWVNIQIEKNNLSIPLRTEQYDDNDEILIKMLNMFEEGRENTIYPYAEKMGNCKVILLGGEHMIYEQKPEECGELILNFIHELE